MKICIDAGHGGSDPGAIGRKPFWLEEKGLALSVALLLEEELESRGHWVVLSRRRDHTLSLQARVDFANRLDADLLISVHANGATRADVEGMEVYHFPGSVIGRRIAVAVLQQMLAAAPGHRNRGVKAGDLFLLRASRMPAILVECEFVTNPRQLQFLSSPLNRTILAEAMALGIHGQDLKGLAGRSGDTVASNRRNPNVTGNAGRH